MFKASPEAKADKAYRRISARAELELKKKAREAERAARDAQKAAERILASPLGRARTAYERGDVLFQYAHDLVEQRRPIASIERAEDYSDPNVALNEIVAEGWRLVSSGFVFCESGSQSYDYSVPLMHSGQTVKVAGTVVGYYVFERDESRKTA